MEKMCSALSRAIRDCAWWGDRTVPAASSARLAWIRLYQVPGRSAGRPIVPQPDGRPILCPGEVLGLGPLSLSHFLSPLCVRYETKFRLQGYRNINPANGFIKAS